MNAVAAGTSDQNSSSVDMKGFYGVMFLASFGALTATQVTSIKAQQSSDDGSADDWTDILGTLVGPLADADGNKMLVLDIYRPLKRYVRLVVDRGTANAVIDGVVALQYDPDKEPVTHSTTVKAAEFHHAPAEGTA
jgi:hypothetical protein